MTVKLHESLNRSFAVRADGDFVYDILHDIWRSMWHMPSIERMEQIGENAALGYINKVGVGPFSVQPSFSNRCEGSRREGVIRFFPANPEDETYFEGTWKVRPEGSGAAVDLEVHVHLSLPLPSFIKGLAGLTARKLFRHYVEVYVRSLERTFNREDARENWYAGQWERLSARFGEDLPGHLVEKVKQKAG